MKKGLSVLLIAAALFGFYGGAVNLNDVLACKDYWEVEGEKSTADMNKLEDGLNQLKENEQAYLDGIDALAEGEQTLADGEAAYAEGQATLAKGEADYAAAPGKLAAGEKALAKGKRQISDLTRLINGLKKANTSFNDYSIDDNGNKGMAWKTGFERKANKADYSDAGLQEARKVITSTISGKADQMALIGSMVNDPNIIANINDDASYKQFDDNVNKLVKAFGVASENLRNFAALANSYASNAQLTQAAGILTSDAAADDAAAKAASDIVDGVYAKLKKNGMDVTKDQVKGILSDSTTAAGYGLSEYAAKYQALTGTNKKAVVRSTAREQVQDQIKAAKEKLGDNLSMVQALDADLYTQLGTALTTLATNSSSTGDLAFAQQMGNLKSGLEQLRDILNGLADELDTNAGTLKSWDAGYQQLKDGQDQLADMDEGIPYAFEQMRTNSTLRKALKAKVPGTYNKLDNFTGTRLADDDMDEFDADMKKVSNIIDKVLPVLRKVQADGQKTLKAGKKELAKGYADYKAAPAKLAAGRAQLAEGAQALVDGRKQLAEGKEKLAEYEDGEQQVRDGLATLMGTEPNGGLTSIFDRRSGDDDFDNGDKHLELDEGLEAVEVGRGYQADSGELITAEITKRAIGTALGLAAGALAVLAGILSLLKKNKGAGVCAILTAIAGGAGVAAGTSAGMEFSSIAGSAVGATPWIAFGVLAGVAVVHAIAHLSSKTVA